MRRTITIGPVFTALNYNTNVSQADNFESACTRMVEEVFVAPGLYLTGIE